MATKGFRVRLDDGSEMDLDSDMLRSWYEQGLIKDETPMRAPGSRNWQRLDQVVELREWKNPDRSRRGAAEDPEEPEAVGPQKWRSYVASGLMFVATGAAAFWMFFPERWTPAVAPVPWREVAMGALVLALSLVRGWPIGRMFTRTVMLLVAFALFPLAGLLIAQGVRGMPLFVMLSAWIVASGFFVFLGREVATSSAVACLVTILLGGAGIYYFGYVPPGTRGSVPASVQAASPAASVAPAHPAGTPASAPPPSTAAAATPVPTAPSPAVAGAPASAAPAPPAGLEQAVRAATQEVPLLSAQAAAAVMAQSAAQVLDPPEVFRRAYGLVGRGLWALDKAESKEMGELHTTIYDSLAPAERSRLGDYIDRARSRYATTPEEDRQMSQVMKTAVLALPPEKRARLQALFEKAMTAGLTKP
jgi:hypothetical protein